MNSLFPAPDLLTELIEESLPWFIAWTVTLALLLGTFIASSVVSRCIRSPLDRLLRRRPQ